MTFQRTEPPLRKKGTLTTAKWSHNKFLNDLKGKTVIATLCGVDDGYVEGRLVHFDQYTLVIEVQSLGEILYFKHAVEAIRAKQ